VPRSPRFVDMVSGEPALYDTRMACQWDESRLYVAYWVEEPQVRATLTERDSFIWNDNDVEFFMSGDDCYYEIEINAFGTVYEVLLVWQDAMKRGGRFDRPELDLYGGNVDLLGGFQDASRWDRHPRGRPRPRPCHARRLDGLRRVDPGAVCGRAGRRGAVPPQGAGAASGPGAAESGAG
jgi:hypothetical protein